MKKIWLVIIISSILLTFTGCGDPAAIYWKGAKPEVTRFSDLRSKFLELTQAQTEGINPTYKSDFGKIISETEIGLSNLKLLKPPPEYSQLNDELVGAYEDMRSSAQAMVSAMDDYESGFPSTMDYLNKGLNYVNQWVDHWKNVGKLKPTEP